MDSILLIGAGGHARACIDVIEQEARFEIGGLIGFSSELGSSVLGYSVIGTDKDIPTLASEYQWALIVVGQIRTAEHRRRLYDLLKTNGYHLPVVVSPWAYVSSHASIDEGSIVMHHAVVNAGASVGKNCILNSKSLVEHDSTLEDYCHISTAATINGGVRVGQGTFIGSNSSVREGVSIGKECVIAMGQIVAKDCEHGTVLRAEVG